MLFYASTRSYTGITSKGTAAVTVRLDSSRRPIPGTEETHPCGLLLIAAGFVGCDRETKSAFGLEADSRGRLMPSDASHHLCGNLFVSGDMRLTR